MTEYLHSYRDLADLAAQAAGPSKLDESDRASRDNDDIKWKGGKTFEQAHALVTSGDIETAAKMRPAIVELIQVMQGQTPRIDPYYKVDGGDFVDVARFVKGDPDCFAVMIDSTPQASRGVSIGINVSISSGTKASEIQTIGESIGSVILALQTQGTPITLYAVEKTTGGNSVVFISAPINPNGMPLDIAKMASILQPWFLRRVLFSLEETYSDKEISTFGFSRSTGGYGLPASLTYADMEKITGKKTGGMPLNISDYVGLNPPAIYAKLNREIKNIDAPLLK